MEHNFEDQCKKVLYVNFVDREKIYNFIGKCNCHVFIDINGSNNEQKNKQTKQNKAEGKDPIKTQQGRFYLHGNQM